MIKLANVKSYFIVLLIGLILILLINIISSIYSKNLIQNYPKIQQIESFEEIVVRRFCSHGVLYLTLSNHVKVNLFYKQINSANEEIDLCDMVKKGNRVIYDGVNGKLTFFTDTGVMEIPNPK